MALERLGGLIKGLENQDSWQAQRQFRLVVLHWPKAVGFAVARQTRPVSIQRATLYVATSTAAWAQTLAYERLNILKKLNRHQRQPLKNIRFSTAQWRQPSKPLQPPLISKQHPSYVAAMSEVVLPLAPLPQTPSEAFDQWAAKVRQMQTTQAMCSRCRCHCPAGELERWGVCSLCAAQNMRG